MSLSQETGLYYIPNLPESDISLAHLILTTIFLRFYLFVSYVFKCLSERISVHHVCTVLLEARRKHKIPWD